MRKAIVSSLIVLGTAFAGTAAHAGTNVNWSVGISAPLANGVFVGTTVGNGYPYYAPPVVVAPAPVYAAPPVVYAPPPVVVVRPRPVYYAPAPVYYAPGYYYGHPGRHWGHRRFHDHDDD